MIVPHPSAVADAIPLVRDLFAALEAEGVRHCHWKSNTHLDRSRDGRNDLDLLVRRSDADRFAATLHGLGFKQAVRRSGALPGVLDLYGYDAAAERIVHVHAHYQLVVGDDLTKNYRIPLEERFLEEALPDRGIPVPPPELELLMLVVRLVLKHRTWDALLTRRSRISPSAREELADLRARVDPHRLDRLLAEAPAGIDRVVFADAERAVAPGAGRLQGIRAGSRLVAALRPCARRSRGADVSLKAWRRAEGIVRRLVRRPAPGKQLAAGGALIAIVGADGAGKSTAVEALAGWLSRPFAVTRVHLGRPPRSWTTRLVRGLTRAWSAAGRVRRGRSIGPGRPQPLLAVALARDRYLACRRIRRVATNGGLVICDRFPLPELELMDAPRLPGGPGARPLARALARLERRFYRAMPRPDVLIVLRVDPEIAVARKPEEPAGFVRGRWAEIWAVDWEAVPAHVVDAGRPRDEVLAHLRSLVWSQI